MLCAKLEQENEIIFQRTRKRSIRMIEHFVIGLDEMCLVSDNHRSLQVVGAVDKKNHENVCRTTEFLSQL